MVRLKGKRERKKKRNWDGTGARKKVSSLWESPSLARRSAGTERVLQRLREESNRGLRKAERRAAQLVLATSLRPEPETHVCWCAWGLSVETQVSADRSWRGRTCQSNGAGVWSGLQLQVCTGWSLLCHRSPMVNPSVREGRPQFWHARSRCGSDSISVGNTQVPAGCLHPEVGLKSGRVPTDAWLADLWCWCLCKLRSQLN